MAVENVLRQRSYKISLLSLEPSGGFYDNFCLLFSKRFNHLQNQQNVKAIISFLLHVRLIFS